MNLQKRNKERGFMIVLALIGLMAMSLFLITGVSTTTTTVKVSGNYTKTVDSFNIAEVGLAKARPTIETTAYDDLLSSATDENGVELIGRTPFNDGFYTVFVKDNDTDNPDENGAWNNDQDNIIIVKSIGENAAGGTVEIEAHLQKSAAATPEPFPTDPSGGPGAAMLCGVESDIAAGGASSIDGRDRTVPTFPCQPSCGIGAVTGTGGRAVISEGPLNATGNLVTDGTVSPAVQGNLGSNTKCDEWRTLRDELAALDESSPHVIVLDGSKYQNPVNTCDDPKVFLINQSGTIKFTANAELCGIFVVGTDVEFDVTGHAVLIGVILVMGDEADLTYTSGSGNPEVYGQVIVQSTSVDKTAEVALTGNADLFYSTEGIGFANEAMNNALNDSGGGGGGGGGLITMAWKETY